MQRQWLILIQLSDKFSKSHLKTLYIDLSPSQTFVEMYTVIESDMGGGFMLLFTEHKPRVWWLNKKQEASELTELSFLNTPEIGNVRFNDLQSETVGSLETSQLVGCQVWTGVIGCSSRSSWLFIIFGIISSHVSEVHRAGTSHLCLLKKTYWFRVYLQVCLINTHTYSFTSY